MDLEKSYELEQHLISLLLDLFARLTDFYLLCVERFGVRLPVFLFVYLFPPFALAHQS